MELAELLQGLRDHADAGEDQAAEVVKGLNEQLPAVHQVIFNAGYARGESKGKGPVTKLETDLKAAQDRVAELQQQLEEKGGGEKAVTELQEKVSHWKGEAERLQGELEAKENEHKQASRTQRLEARLADVKAKLTQRLVPEYGELLAKDPDLRGRLRYDDDGNLELLQKGSDRPIPVPEGKDPVDLLVDEVVKATPAKFVRQDVPTGSGVGGGGGGGGAKSVTERVAADLAKERDARPNPLAKRGPAGAGAVTED